MQLRVLAVVDRKRAEEVLKEDWVKRTGAFLREGLAGRDGVFLVVRAEEDTVKRLLETGAFKEIEEEEELIKAVEEEEERSTAGVGLLGL